MSLSCGARSVIRPCVSVGTSVGHQIISQVCTTAITLVAPQQSHSWHHSNHISGGELFVKYFHLPDETGQNISCQGGKSIRRSRLHYLPEPIDHGFSIYGDVYIKAQGFRDLFHHLNPNFWRDRHRFALLVVGIPGTDKFYLGPKGNQLVLGKVHIFPDRNPRDFQFEDR